MYLYFLTMTDNKVHVQFLFRVYTQMSYTVLFSGSTNSLPQLYLVIKFIFLARYPLIVVHDKILISNPKP